ncbi:MAG: hypothetical protein U0821_11205 [Chloroflexota bacterium]
MSRLDSIKQQIWAPSGGEITELRRWLAEIAAEIWDRRIAADAEAGRLDDLARAALRQHAEGDSVRL